MGENLSKIVQSGKISINNIVASDPSVPLGGKKSGFGIELSRYGMLELSISSQLGSMTSLFTNIM